MDNIWTSNYNRSFVLFPLNQFIAAIWGHTTSQVVSEEAEVVVEQPFEYPPLDELRVSFEATGLYTSAQIDEAIKAYGRLPKYRAHSRSACRSKERGSKS